MSQVYLNGAFVEAASAQVSVMDRGFLFGDAVYEVIPSYGGYFLRLEAHLTRLERSLDAVRLPNPHTRAQWRDILGRLIGAPPAADQSVYLQVTRGAAPRRDHLCPEGIAPTVFAVAAPLAPRDPEVAERGVACVTRPDLRWQRCDIKTTSLIAAVMLRREAADASALEAILIRDGLVTEGAVSNLFVAREGAILTPPQGPHLLPGITRELVLALAAERQMPLLEQPIPEVYLQTADEIWLSSSTREVLPVTQLDGRPVGCGRPGPLWAALNGLYQDYKARVRNGEIRTTDP